MPNPSSHDGCDELFYEMDWLMFWIVFGSVVAGFVGLLSLIYFAKRGQFEDQEEVKYQMFHEDEGDA